MRSTRRQHALGPGIFVLLGATLFAPRVRAQDASVAPDAAADRDGAVGHDAAAPDPRVAQIEALRAGSLAVVVAPQSLFEVPLDDESALQVERVRLRALVDAADAARDAGVADARAHADAAVAATLRDDIAALDPGRWNARAALDRARLAFYSLDRGQREALLRTHAARQAAARPHETDAERRAREAAADRQHERDAARAARGEAERLVAEELTRLERVDARVRTVRADFADARAQMAARRDVVLGWVRRVRDAEGASADEADATYDALRRALRAARDDLDAALHADASDVPALGPDPLVDLPADVATDSVRARRHAVERDITDARHDERAVREAQAATRLDEITALNRGRLELLAYLSSDKRDAITGFTAAGWDQARSELRHLTLILRYHEHVARAWLGSLRAGGPSGVTPWRAAWVLLPWLLFIGAFAWATRRTHALLRLAELRLGEAERAAGRTSPSALRHGLRVLTQVRRTVESLAFFAVALWLLPSGARGLLEVQLVTSAVGWILGGALIVNTLDASAAGTESASARTETTASGALRLRSLRLVGRTIVLFALILVLSARLVGQGTIYSWVFSTCWFAAIPVFLVLVRWWRGTVFERISRTRRPSRIEAWVLSNREGWQSFLAAMIGAVQFFVVGVFKTARGWLSRFDLTRRAHAYLFRREIERLGDERTAAPLRPLGAAARDALDPERAYTQWIAGPVDARLDALVNRVTAGHGGLVAVIGARGMGKSSLLRAIHERIDDAVRLACDAQTSVDDIRRAARLDDATTSPPRLILLDDAHALVKPLIGGLALFDEISALARAHDASTTWAFALDATLWPFLRRARDARPLFDETHVLVPWNERQIGTLIADRDASAGITPTFEDLLEKLPPGADEVDRLDALRAKQVGYERMLWDHVRGNPALALEAWRASLAEAPDGVVHVRPLHVPDATTLDALPDSALFILRAVLQLGPAALDDVAQATRLNLAQVVEATRFGQAQGFFAEHHGRIRVTWPWLRAVVNLLERRHLLVVS